MSKKSKIKSLKELLELEETEAILFIKNIVSSDYFYNKNSENDIDKISDATYFLCKNLLIFDKDNPIKTKVGELVFFEPDHRLIDREGYLVAQIKYAVHQVTHERNDVGAAKRVFDKSKYENLKIIYSLICEPDKRAIDPNDENKVYYYKALSTKKHGIVVFRAWLEKHGHIRYITIMPDKPPTHWNKYETGNNENREVRYSLASLFIPLPSSISKKSTEETKSGHDNNDSPDSITNIQPKNSPDNKKDDNFEFGGPIQGEIVLLEPYFNNNSEFKQGGDVSGELILGPDSKKVLVSNDGNSSELLKDGGQLFRAKSFVDKFAAMPFNEFFAHAASYQIEDYDNDKTWNDTANELILYKPESYPIILKTIEVKGKKIDFRQSGEKLKYVATRPNGEIIREENGNATYMSDEELVAKNIPLYDETIYAFDGEKRIGWVANSFGVPELFIRPEYQRLGIGTELLYEYLMQMDGHHMRHKGFLGQFTQAGIRTIQKLHERFRGLEKGGQVDQDAMAYVSIENQFHSVVACHRYNKENEPEVKAIQKVLDKAMDEGFSVKSISKADFEAHSYLDEITINELKEDGGELEEPEETQKTSGYAERVKKNMDFMHSKLDEWRAVKQTGVQRVTGPKGFDIELPLFDFPKDYKQARSMYPMPSSEPLCCELCGKVPIKIVYWIQNDSKKLTLRVGSECVRYVGDGSSGKDQQRLAKLELAKKLDEDMIALSAFVAENFSRVRTGNYGKKEREWKTWFIGKDSGIESIEKHRELMQTFSPNVLLDEKKLNKTNKDTLYWRYVYSRIPVYGYESNIKNAASYGKEEATIDKEILTWFTRNENLARLLLEQIGALVPIKQNTENTPS